jgi:enamine deaminase RidA (YjgF/YER057c/UK114 family)
LRVKHLLTEDEKKMNRKVISPAPNGGHAEAIEISNATRILCISGQTPENEDGSIPGTFREQCRVAWQKIESRLDAAGMTLENLAQVRMFLADRALAAENRELRREVLGRHTPALAVVVADLLDERWLVEIEALALA